MFMVLGGCVKLLINLLFSCCLFLALASIQLSSSSMCLNKKKWQDFPVKLRLLSMGVIICQFIVLSHPQCAQDTKRDERVKVNKVFFLSSHSSPSQVSFLYPYSSFNPLPPVYLFHSLAFPVANHFHEDVAIRATCQLASQRVSTNISQQTDMKANGEAHLMGCQGLICQGSVH